VGTTPTRTYTESTDWLIGLYAAGDIAFTGGNDMILRQYNLTTGTLMRTYSGHTGYIAAITVSGDYVFSGGDARFAGEIIY
jgi:WD40 repeat protein